MVLVTMMGDSLFLLGILLLLAAFLWNGCRAEANQTRQAVGPGLSSGVGTGNIRLSDERSLAILIVLYGLFLYLAVHLLKMAIAVPRPHPLYGGSARWAFPSGHAAMSMYTYGLLARVCTEQRRTLAGVLLPLALGLLILLIGFSRIYLGAHWPGDVLAGYSLGLIALTLLPPSRCTVSLHGRKVFCLICLAIMTFGYWLARFSTSMGRYSF